MEKEVDYVRRRAMQAEHGAADAKMTANRVDASKRNQLSVLSRDVDHIRNALHKDEVEKLRELLSEQGESVREALECLGAENAKLKSELERMHHDYRAVMVEG